MRKADTPSPNAAIESGAEPDGVGNGLAVMEPSSVASHAEDPMSEARKPEADASHLHKAVLAPSSASSPSTSSHTHHPHPTTSPPGTSWAVGQSRWAQSPGATPFLSQPPPSLGSSERKLSPLVTSTTPTGDSPRLASSFSQAVTRAAEDDGQESIVRSGGAGGAFWGSNSGAWPSTPGWQRETEPAQGRDSRLSSNVQASSESLPSAGEWQQQQKDFSLLQPLAAASFQLPASPAVQSDPDADARSKRVTVIPDDVFLVDTEAKAVHAAKVRPGLPPLVDSATVIRFSAAWRAAAWFGFTSHTQNTQSVTCCGSSGAEGVRPQAQHLCNPREGPRCP